MNTHYMSGPTIKQRGIKDNETKLQNCLEWKAKEQHKLWEARNQKKKDSSEWLRRKESEWE